VIPPADEIEIIDRKVFTGPRDEYLPYKADADLVPPMVAAGDGYRIHTTGLTHDERGYPAMSADAHDVLVRRLCDKITKNIDDIAILEEHHLDDADVVVVAYGISARVAYRAVELARQAGIKCGMLRLVTVWPFPEQRIRELAANVNAFVVPEVNLGQIVLEVERCAGGKAETHFVGNPGGHVILPTEILEAIESAASGARQEMREPAYAD
jgi:2-oxoglutarate ferredoxin oxidoreductase subunit alpha